MRDAKAVVTDCGGMQEETTALGVPCITVRDNTERPITIEEGTNTLIGADPARILPIVEDILRTGGKTGRKPAFWDGKAAERIAAEAEAFLRARARSAPAETPASRRSRRFRGAAAPRGAAHLSHLRNSLFPKPKIRAILRRQPLIAQARPI